MKIKSAPVLPMPLFRRTFIVPRVFRPGDFCARQRKIPASKEAGYNGLEGGE